MAFADALFSCRCNKVSYRGGSQLAGVHLVRTGLPSRELTAITGKFQKLFVVENAFRGIQNANLSVLPIIYDNSQRVLCHIDLPVHAGLLRAVVHPGASGAADVVPGGRRRRCQGRVHARGGEGRSVTRDVQEGMHQRDQVLRGGTGSQDLTVHVGQPGMRFAKERTAAGKGKAGIEIVAEPTPKQARSLPGVRIRLYDRPPYSSTH